MIVFASLCTSSFGGETRASPFLVAKANLFSEGFFRLRCDSGDYVGVRLCSGKPLPRDHELIKVGDNEGVDISEGADAVKPPGSGQRSQSRGRCRKRTALSLVSHLE